MPSPSQAPTIAAAPVAPPSRDRRQPVLPDQREQIPTVVQFSTADAAIPATTRAPLAADIPPSDLDPTTPVPLIYYLPIGTNVALLPGSTQPKSRPWTIRDLEPRHHIFSGFNNLSGREQHDLIYVHGYLPYDLYGNAVLCEYQPERRGYRHVFAGEPSWSNPVRQDHRVDAPAELGHGKGPVRDLSTKEEVAKRQGSSGAPGAGQSERAGQSSKRVDGSEGKKERSVRNETPQKGGEAGPGATPGSGEGGFTAANR